MCGTREGENGAQGRRQETPLEQSFNPWWDANQAHDNTATFVDSVPPIPHDDLIQTARNLARNTGWPVFPCAETKRPACAHGFKDATRDPAEISRLFRVDGAALIAIPTGPASGLDVLDVDVKHDAARAWLAMAEAMIPPTRTFRTQSGGVHLYFRHAENVANTQSRLARGIDTRGSGGYVVYWFAAGLECLDHTPPAPWPSWLLSTLLRPPEPAPLPAPGRRYKGNGARPQAMVRRALDRVAGAAEGHRHDTLRAAARTIGGLLDAADLSRDHAAGLLLDAILRAGGAAVDQRNATATIRYGLDQGAASPLTLGAA